MRTGEKVITVVGDCPHTILGRTRIGGLEKGELNTEYLSQRGKRAAELSIVIKNGFTSL